MDPTDWVRTAEVAGGVLGAQAASPGRAANPPPAVHTLPVSECFGPTIQGEGPAAGRLAVFIRFMGCNLSCSWCDTPYTWDARRHDLRAETTLMPAEAIADRVAELADGRRPIVVLTGGEPLLQLDQPGFVRLLELLGDGRRGGLLGLGLAIHVETNGTVAPRPYLLHHARLIVLSPKLGHAGPHRGRQDPALHPAWLDLLRDHPWDGGVIAKIVVRGADDVTEVARLADEWGVPRDRVWVMPEGTSRAALDYRWPEVAEAATAHGVNATHRLHVLAWGDERGR